MQASGILAWFQLADSNQMIFSNTLCNDVLVRTTRDDQRILIGPALTTGGQSTMTVSKSNITINGNVNFTTGMIKSDNNSTLFIEKVSFSNGRMQASNIIATSGATIQGPMHTSSITVNGIMLVDSNGNFSSSNIPDNTMPGWKLSNYTIGTTKYSNLSIDTVALSNRSITTPKYAMLSVDTIAMSNASITSTKFVTGSVDSNAVGAGQLYSGHYNPESVDTLALKRNAVTTVKLDSNLTLNGVTKIMGQIGINTTSPPATASFDVYGPMSFTSNQSQVFLYTAQSNLGINVQSPAYRLDVGGDINFSGQLWNMGPGPNATRWYPGRWFSPTSVLALPGSGSNIYFGEGYVGVNKLQPRQMLHISGHTAIDSNLLFYNSWSPTNPAVTLTTFQSNLGLNVSPLNPQQVLDIGGNLGIRGTQIVSGERNMMEIHVASFNSNVGIKNTNPTYELDVNGNVRFYAKRFMMNSNVMNISARASAFTDPLAYYKLVDLKSTTDVTNFGAAVIHGDIGHNSYDTGAYVSVTIGTHDAQTKTGSPYKSVCYMRGGVPNVVAPLTDLLLYMNPDNTFTVYLKTTNGSHMNLCIQGSTIIQKIYHDWEITKSLTAPTLPVAYQCSLINNPSTFFTGFQGDTSIGSDTVIAGSLKCVSACNMGTLYTQGNITSAASNIRFFDGGLTPMFEIDKIANATRLTVNASRSNNSWVADQGELTALQVDMNTAILPSGTDAAFYFNALPLPTNVDNTQFQWSNWATLRNASLGINGIRDPKATLHVAGDALFQANNSPTTLIGAYDYTAAVGAFKKIVFGKSNGTNNSVELAYNHQGPNALTNMFDIGFTNNTLMTLMANGNFGVGKRPPQERLDVAGIANFDGYFSLQPNGSDKRLLSFSRIVTSQTALSSEWFKLAEVPGTPATSPYNQCSVCITGTLLQYANAMQFRLLLSLDASSQTANFAQLTYDTTLTNYFLNVFDVVAYVDAQKTFHIYAKCSADYLTINLDVGVQQAFGAGPIAIFTNRTYSNLLFADGSRPITAKDSSIVTPVQFVVSAQSSHEKRAFLRSGFMGLGTDTPTSRLQVSGTTTTDTLIVTTGAIQSSSPTPMSFNGTALVDSTGSFITANIPNASIMTEKLNQSTISYIHDTFGFSNFYPFTTGFGFYNSNPQYSVDVRGPVAINAASNIGAVVLYSSKSNGLGVNVLEPKFPLDVLGGINFTGKLYRNGEIFEISKWTQCNTTIAYGSNVSIGPGIFNPIESLSVYSTISLSNQTGKTVLYSSNGMLAVNHSNPSSTLDVNGTLGINGVQILTSNRSLSNIANIYSTTITSTPMRVGIQQPTPQFTLDVNGDVNFTGMLYYQGVPHMRQWNGSNMGITYSNNVGIRVDIPANETLSVLSNMSFSNANGKSVLTLANTADMLQCSTSFTAPAIAVSNNTGASWMYSTSSNLGIYTTTPQDTLDINGTLGISGTRVLDRDRTLSNVTRLYTDLLTVSGAMVGVNWRTPNATLGVIGTFAISNQGWMQMTMANNVLAISSPSLATSNVYINAANTITPALCLSNNSASVPALAISGQTSYSHMQSINPFTPACYMSLSNATDFARIGLDGLGLTTFLFQDMLTIQTSRGMRLLTSSNQTRMTILANGNMGLLTANPAHPIDLGGNVGMAGSLFVDIFKNMYAKVGTFTQVVASNVTPSVVTKVTRNIMSGLTITGQVVGVSGLRYTETGSPSYYSFSNLVFNNPGKLVMIYNDNMYFGGGRTNDATPTYTTFAYQPVMAGTDVPSAFSSALDAYVINDNNRLNFVGNAQLAADTLEMVNPCGRSQKTTFRMRNWNYTNIAATASNPGLDYAELQLDTQTNTVTLNSDKEFNISYQGAKRMTITGTSSNVYFPGTMTMNMDILAGSGQVPVYTDNNGRLFKYAGPPSDRRMKEQVQPISYGLDTITKLEPVSFFWNTAFTNPKTGDTINLQDVKGSRQELGLIAQDAGTVVPECVGQSDDGTLTFDYQKLIPVLIKSVQELKKENDVLRRDMQWLLHLAKIQS